MSCNLPNRAENEGKMIINSNYSRNNHLCLGNKQAGKYYPTKLIGHTIRGFPLHITISQ
jgi:hypothetical protein